MRPPFPPVSRRTCSPLTLSSSFHSLLPVATIIDMLSRLAPRLFIAAPQYLPRSARLFSSSSFPRAVPSDDPVDAHLGTPLTRLDDAFFRRNAFSTPGSEAVACQSGWLLANASKLKNKVVLITGVGGLDSLGGQLAVKLATKYGAKVVVSDSTEEGIVETVLEIHKAGGYVLSSPPSNIHVVIVLFCSWATGLAINSNVWAEQLRLFVRLSEPCCLPL